MWKWLSEGSVSKVRQAAHADRLDMRKKSECFERVGCLNVMGRSVM